MAESSGNSTTTEPDFERNDTSVIMDEHGPNGVKSKVVFFETISGVNETEEGSAGKKENASKTAINPQEAKSEYCYGARPKTTHKSSSKKTVRISDKPPVQKKKPENHQSIGTTKKPPTKLHPGRGKADYMTKIQPRNSRDKQDKNPAPAVATNNGKDNISRDNITESSSRVIPGPTIPRKKDAKLAPNSASKSNNMKLHHGTKKFPVDHKSSALNKDSRTNTTKSQHRYKHESDSQKTVGKEMSKTKVSEMKPVNCKTRPDKGDNRHYREVRSEGTKEKSYQTGGNDSKHITVKQESLSTNKHDESSRTDEKGNTFSGRQSSYDLSSHSPKETLKRNTSYNGEEWEEIATHAPRLDPHKLIKVKVEERLTQHVNKGHRNHPTGRQTKEAVVVVTYRSLLNEDIIEDHLEDYLQDSFRFEICNITSHKKRNQTICELLFPTDVQAKKFAHVMNKTSTPQENAVACSARLDMKNTKYKYLKREWKTIAQKTSRMSCNLKLKIFQLEQKLNNLPAVEEEGNFSILNKAMVERDALKQKIKEMTGHLIEFNNRLATLEEFFLSLAQNPGRVRERVEELKDAVDIEISRFQTALPIYARRQAIVEMVQENPVSVLLGETGSGKSTQIAQYLHEAGLTTRGTIVCTQPRKVAATSLAKRVSEELKSQLGQTVGFKVGMQAKISRNTKILFVTDHMLLKECVKDPSLKKYSCIIVDEAHERSLYTDLLLGMIKQALPKRPDLKVIITSATIDPDIFRDYFDWCPLLTVSGRAYPVDVIYSDIQLSPDKDYEIAAVQTALSIAETESPGDILVFLTTPVETERASEKAQAMWKHGKDNLLCLSLHGKTQQADQQKIFEDTPEGKRKIVFATNCAETSITIPGIVYVVDTGLAKEKTYDPVRNMDTLLVTKISKSSADQRKGRAGRTASGKCYRLYSNDDYQAMEAMTKAEILRIHLGIAILHLMAISSSNMNSFDFVEMPPEEALDRAKQLLEFLGAVSDDHLTELGEKMAKLSLEPQLAKMLLQGIDEGIGYESILITAFCSTGGNMFFRGMTDEDKTKADKLKLKFCSAKGDIHTMLEVYKIWSKLPDKKKTQWCFDYSINAKCMRMINDSIKEITGSLNRELNITVHEKYQDEGTFDSKIRQVLLESFTMNICHFIGHERLGYILLHNQYQTDKILHVHPSSALKYVCEMPEILIFQNTLTTSRDFVINATTITSDMLDVVARDNQYMDVTSVKNKLVTPHPIDNIGWFVLKKITGAKWESARAIERQLQQICDTNLLVVDTDFEKGSFVIYCSTKNSEKALKYVKDIIDKEKLKLREEDIEGPIEEGSGTRAIIQRGATVKCLLFPGDFRSFLVTKIPQTSSQGDILDIIGKVGRIKNCRIINQGKKNAKMTVIYDQADDAKAALDLLSSNKELESLSVNPVINQISTFSSYKYPEITIKLTWCRRPTKGVAFINFHCKDEEEEEYHAKRLADRCDGIYDVKVSEQDERQLFAGSVSKDDLHDDIVRDIKGDLLEIYPILPDTTEIFVPRERVPLTTQSDIEDIHDTIKGHLESKLGPGQTDMRIVVKHPKSENTFFHLAFVHVSDQVTGRKIFQILQRIKIFGRRIFVSLDVPASLVVQPDVYPYVAEKIKCAVEIICDKFGDSVQIERKKFSNGAQKIMLQSNSFDHLAEARIDMIDAVSGKQIVLDKRRLDYFYAKQGDEFLQSITDHGEILIKKDPRTTSLLLYGKDDTQLEDIKSQIENQCDSIKEHPMEYFNLKEEYSKGMIKLLVKKYGFDLHDLLEETGLEVVDFELKQHILSVQGDAKSIQNIKDILANLSESLDMRKEVNTGKPDCPVCLDTLDEDSVYRLEYCGHDYCRDCVKQMFLFAIQNKDLPMKCAMEGCEEEVVVKDILTIVGGQPEDLATLTKAAVEQYVINNKDSLRFCITPDCNMVYKPTNFRQAIVCEGCSVSICTMCHVQYHDGISCKMNRGIQKREDADEQGMKEFLMADKKNHAVCPNCGCGIIKDGGCNHVQCTQCKIHVCWKCKDTFSKSKETYEHLNKVHGAYQDDFDMELL